jgi:hypothetical protein
MTATARNQLTSQYLDQVAWQQIESGALPEHVARTLDLRPTVYQGRCLTRPAFLSGPERAVLEQDLTQLRAALAALPDRLFDGDLGRFARALGADDRLVQAVQRSASAELTRLARADMYHDGTAFRLMELNVGSPIGGLDNAVLNRALLGHPFVADFVAARKLSYVDGLAAVVETMRVEGGLAPEQRLAVAAVDWPASFVQIAPLLHASAAALAPYGVDAVACHLGQLRRKGGRVWVDDRPVDAIYRIFMLEDLRDPAGPELIEPVLQAVERDEVAMFTPLGTDLYASKAALAMISDEAYRDRYQPAELASLDRLLPWTRMVRDGPVTVDGQRVDLRELAAERREQLVLKPTSSYGGQGVVQGWQVDDAQWRREVAAAMDRPYVLQQRLRGEPEPFPDGAGLAPWLLRWGVFTASRGFAGAIVIGSPDLTGAVLNIGGGATGGCCFHEPGPAEGPA